MSNAFSVASAAPRLCPVTVMLSSSSWYMLTSFATSLNTCMATSITVLVVAGLRVPGGVHGQPPSMHHGVGSFVPEEALGWHHDEVHVLDPLQRLHRAAPRDDDVAAPERSLPFVGGHRDVPDPVALPAPARARRGPEDERLRHGDARRRVHEPGDAVRRGVARQLRPLEEAARGEPREARVRRELLVVEGVVRRLRHLAVADDGAAEVEVERVQEAVPVALTMELPPPPRRAVTKPLLR
ncbi:Os05g0573950, partial [Oryza sativa Japonica Group]